MILYHKKGSNGSAVRSVSGRLLDGEFSGNFPSGNGIDGGDFVVDFALK